MSYTTPSPTPYFLASSKQTDCVCLRTPVLFRFYSVFLVAELVANPLGGFLVSKGAWLTLWIGNVFILTVLASVFILPETLSVRRWHDKKAGKVPSPRLAPLGVNDTDDELLKKSNIRAALDDAREQLVEVWDFLIGNRRIVVLMLPLIFVTLGKYVQEMLLQYATKRFGWSWSKVGRHLQPPMEISSLTKHSQPRPPTSSPSSPLAL